MTRTSRQEPLRIACGERLSSWARIRARRRLLRHSGWELSNSFLSTVRECTLHEEEEGHPEKSGLFLLPALIRSCPLQLWFVDPLKLRRARLPVDDSGRNIDQGSYRARLHLRLSKRSQRHGLRGQQTIEALK